MLYIPRRVAEAVGIREGTVVRLRVNGNKVLMEVVPDPFELALRGPKFARTSFEELERESGEMQDELLGGQA